MDCSTAKCFSHNQDWYPCFQGHIPRALTNWANSPSHDKIMSGMCVTIMLAMHVSQLIYTAFSTCIYQNQKVKLFLFNSDMCQTYMNMDNAI